MHEWDDWELVARTRSGDLEAFAELVRRYQGPVVGFCRRMVGSAQDAEDVAQETFVRLHRHIGRLEPRAQFSTVLFGIARNLALNFLRDARRRGRDTAAPLTEHMVAASTDRPDQQARLREIEAALEQAVSELSEDHREVLVLREFQGLDYESIAKIVRCRVGTVRSRLARAREQLRLRLIERGGELL
jgi:RNA polymerase sigma-70 factor (ECF subfamily)